MCALNLEARASDMNAQVSASMTSARGFILKRTSWRYDLTIFRKQFTMQRKMCALNLEAPCV